MDGQNQEGGKKEGRRHGSREENRRAEIKDGQKDINAETEGWEQIKRRRHKEESK